MDRLEFNKEKAAIPMAKGPYSSLFNYDQEEADLKAQGENDQRVQQKIMKTNALGDAFRLLAEGVGAFGGATITPRNVNPGILSAVNEYGKNDTEYMQRLERLKTKKLALGQADLQYKMGVSAAEAERTHQETMQTNKDNDNYLRELKLQENLGRIQGDKAKEEDARKKINLVTEYQLQVEVARKKEQFARGMDLTAGQPTGTGTVVNVPPKSEVDKKAQSFIVPDNKKEIWMSQGLIDDIRTNLQTGKGKYDQSVPQVLRDAMNNKTVQMPSLKTAISDNWDYVKNHILSSDVYKQIYGTEPGQGTVPQPSAQSGIPTAVTVKGVTDLDANSKEQLVVDSHAVLDKTPEDQKLKVVKNLIIERYKAIGKMLPSKDVDNDAREIVRQWRQEARKATQDTTKSVK